MAALVQQEQKLAKEQMKRVMLQEVKDAIKRRHGTNSKFIIAKMERSYDKWAPKKKVSLRDVAHAFIMLTCSGW